MTKTKIALAAALLAGTASLATAQEADPNLFNRYQSLQNGGAVATQSQGFQSAPVALTQGRNVQVRQNGRANAVQTFHYDSAPLISGGGY